MGDADNIFKREIKKKKKERDQGQDCENFSFNRILISKAVVINVDIKFAFYIHY